MVDVKKRYKDSKPPGTVYMHACSHCKSYIQSLYTLLLIHIAHATHNMDWEVFMLSLLALVSCSVILL
jgi:hypothetical protein